MIEQLPSATEHYSKSIRVGSMIETKDCDSRAHTFLWLVSTAYEMSDVDILSELNKSPGSVLRTNSQAKYGSKKQNVRVVQVIQ